MAKKKPAITLPVEPTQFIQEAEIGSDKPSELLPDYLSSGSTLLNLACTGDHRGCFKKGHYYYIVGDSQSGKTFLSLTCLAEAAINPAFSEHRFIFDNSEKGALMDVRRYFGEAVAERIEPPAVAKKTGESIFSTTIEEFYYHLDDAIAQKEPFIYVMDSMDSLDSEYAQEKFQAHKVAHRTGKDSPGSYGDGKAKKNSEFLRQVITPLDTYGSILIVISQTRDNIGGYGKTRAGGKALRFYATLEMWSRVEAQLKKTVNGKARVIGSTIEVHVKKNRVTGRDRTVSLDIYPSFGFDDVGSCVDFLVEEKHWGKAKSDKADKVRASDDKEKKKDTTSKINAHEFSLEAQRETIIRKIEERPNGPAKLRRIVAKVWRGIEEACEVKRVPRYK